MFKLLSVFLGGALGASLRYFVNLLVTKFTTASFFATFLVNIIGCLFIGFLYGISQKYNLNPYLKLFLTVGFLGGLTTFSTFCQESFLFLKDEKFLYFILYTAGSIIIGLTAFYLGFLFSNK